MSLPSIDFSGFEDSAVAANLYLTLAQNTIRRYITDEEVALGYHAIYIRFDPESDCPYLAMFEPQLFRANPTIRGLCRIVEQYSYDSPWKALYAFWQAAMLAGDPGFQEWSKKKLEITKAKFCPQENNVEARISDNCGFNNNGHPDSVLYDTQVADPNHAPHSRDETSGIDKSLAELSNLDLTNGHDEAEPLFSRHSTSEDDHPYLSNHILNEESAHPSANLDWSPSQRTSRRTERRINIPVFSEEQHRFLHQFIGGTQALDHEETTIRPVQGGHWPEICPQEHQVPSHSPPLFFGNRSVRLSQPPTPAPQQKPALQDPSQSSDVHSPFFGHQHQTAQYSMEYPYERVSENVMQRPKGWEEYNQWGYE